MNISQAQLSVSFAGKVNMDKAQIAKEIAKVDMPINHKSQEQIDSIIGNINTLKQRIETQTHPDREYQLDLQVNLGRCIDVKYPSYFNICVNDLVDQTKYKASCKLGYNCGPPTYAQWPKDGQYIWEEGFKKLTEDILKNGQSSPEDRKKELERASLERALGSEKVVNIFNRLV